MFYSARITIYFQILLGETANHKTHNGYYSPLYNKISRKRRYAKPYGFRKNWKTL